MVILPPSGAAATSAKAKVGMSDVMRTPFDRRTSVGREYFRGSLHE
jgi:hypothetical protein